MQSKLINDASDERRKLTHARNVRGWQLGQGEGVRTSEGFQEKLILYAAHPSQSGGQSALIKVAISVVITVAFSHALGPRSQSHAITINLMQSYAITSNDMQTYAITCNHMRSHAITCNQPRT
jgi:hypothetical protein